MRGVRGVCPTRNSRCGVLSQLPVRLEPRVLLCGAVEQWLASQQHGPAAVGSGEAGDRRVQLLTESLLRSPIPLTLPVTLDSSDPESGWSEQVAALSSFQLLAVSM